MSRRFGWPCIISDPKGGTLFVNLGASQAVLGSRGLGTDFARCKLAGRNQAVIAHTKHLAELEAKFTDQGFFTTEPR